MPNLKLIPGIGIQFKSNKTNQIQEVSTIDLDIANKNQKGLTKFANEDEINIGKDIDKAVDIQYLINILQNIEVAGPGKQGIVDIADDLDIIDGTSTTKVITVRQLINTIKNIPDASEITNGLIQLATDTEAVQESNTMKAVVPKQLSFKENKYKKNVANGYAPLDANIKLPRANQYDTSTTNPGIIRLATNAEVAAGTPTNVAVNPSQLKTTDNNIDLATVDLNNRYNIIKNRIEAELKVLFANLTANNNAFQIVQNNMLKNLELLVDKDILNADAKYLNGQPGSYYRCASGCSWTCMSACSGGCTSCTSTCSAQCKGSCAGSCAGSCVGTCNGCSGCGNGCGGGCSGCSDSCTRSCTSCSSKCDDSGTS